jgi:hypothetical protein
MTTATDQVRPTAYDRGTSVHLAEQRPAWRLVDETTAYGYALQPALLSSWLTSQELKEPACFFCSAVLPCQSSSPPSHRARRSHFLMPVRSHEGEYCVVVTIKGREGLQTEEFVADQDETTSDRLAALLRGLIGRRPNTEPRERAQRALQAVEELQDWLDLTIHDVASLIGVSGSAVHYWKRETAPLRPQHALKLNRVHALIRALRSAAPERHPFELLNATSDPSGVSAYELLSTGRYDEAERLLRPLIFRPEEAPVQTGPMAAMEPEVAPPPARGLDLRPTTRRAKRVRLKRD